jgi:hypothetical protein
MLRASETDIAVILTEGIVKDIVAGTTCTVYVESFSLMGFTWLQNQPYKTISDLENKNVRFQD